LRGAKLQGVQFPRLPPLQTRFPRRTLEWDSQMLEAQEAEEAGPGWCWAPGTGMAEEESARRFGSEP